MFCSSRFLEKSLTIFYPIFTWIEEVIDPIVESIFPSLCWGQSNLAIFILSNEKYDRIFFPISRIMNMRLFSNLFLSAMNTNMKLLPEVFIIIRNSTFYFVPFLRILLVNKQ